MPTKKTTPARGLKSTSQVRCIFGCAKRALLSDDELRAIVEEVTGQRSIAALSRYDADRVIVRLGGQPLTPRRTTQHRRRRAGVSQLATASQLDLMRSLARHRNMSDEGLERLSIRQCGHYPPRTTADANKVIEALRAMNRREGLWY